MDTESDWPQGDGTARIQDYGVDVSGRHLYSPAITYDLMSYCWTDGRTPVWVSPHTYQRIFDQSLARQSSIVLEARSATQSYHLVSGLVRSEGTAELDPIWDLQTSATLPQLAGTAYCLEAQDAGHTVLTSHCFDLDFINHHTGQLASVDNFNILLPKLPNVARIVLKKELNELAFRIVSSHAPSVTVILPNSGETWLNGTQTITWSGSDLDGDALSYSVLYSLNGINWIPVGTGITSTQLIINAAELAGGTAARIRVLATDGVNAGYDDSDGTFTVRKKHPSAFILAPEDGVRVMPGTPLWLQGRAYDLEDDALPDSAYRWQSNRDGDLGTGATNLVILSPGPHVITLTVTDSDGTQATATTRLSAGDRVFLPMVLRAW